MTNRMSKWLVAVVGIVLGLLIATADWIHYGSPVGAVLSFVICAGYALAVVGLRSRSETASLLAGIPLDERWESINLRAFAVAGKVIVVVLLAVFIGSELTGGDPLPYAFMAAAFALAYLGGILWYRWRS
jgi:hypothetical protein